MPLRFWVVLTVLPIVCWVASIVPPSEGRWRLVEAITVSLLVIIHWALQQWALPREPLERSFSLALFMYATIRSAYGGFQLLPCAVLAAGSLAGFPGAVHSAWPMAVYGYWGRASPRLIAILMTCAALYLAAAI